MRRRNAHAFTIIEIMIVIVVIGILLGIMIPNYLQARAEAQLAACNQNMLTIVDAITVARLSNPDIVANPAGTSGDGYYIDSTCPLVTSGYLKSVPMCPAHNRVYLLMHNMNHPGHYSIQHSHADSPHKRAGYGGIMPIYDSYRGKFCNSL